MKLVDRYRPKKLDKVYGHKRIKESLRKFLEQEKLPHMLFIGKNGVGKTVIAEALQIEFGVMKQDYLFINASEERGIDTIRNKVINFSRTMKTLTSPFKICVLDEADNLTKAAQKAFRRVMEDTPNTVFILTGNNIRGISSALQSRCTIFNFRALHYAHMERLISDVWRKEGGNPNKGVITAIRQLAHGDARLALNTLEAILTLESPTPEDVYQLHGVADEENLFHLVHSMLKGDMKALSIAYQLSKESNPMQVIQGMYYATLRNNIRGLDDAKRLAIIRAIGEVPGASAEHTLMSIVAKVIMERKK